MGLKSNYGQSLLSMCTDNIKMSDTIKSLATLLSAVRGLNEDKRAMEHYAAKKMIDMKLEEELYEKKLADKRIENVVNDFTNAEAAVLTGQSSGTLPSVGDVQRTIKKKQVGSGAFALCLGWYPMVTFIPKKDLVKNK